MRGPQTHSKAWFSLSNFLHYFENNIVIDALASITHASKFLGTSINVQKTIITLKEYILPYMYKFHI